MITKIYANNVELDLYGDFDFNITYQINDIREVEKKATSFSYSFTIPGTKTNNQLFGNIFEIGNDNIIFNPNRKTDVLVFVDGNQVFKGFLQLIKVVKDSNDKIDYDVTIMGPLGNLFYDIGDGRLEDLDFSEYNHTLTRTNISKSWDTSIKRNGQDIPFQYGRGYVYPMIQYGRNTTPISEVEEWYPAIYAKDYFDRIFDQAGYTYKSEFLNSFYFKQLVVPFSKDKILISDAETLRRGAERRRITSDYVQAADPTVVQEKYMTPTWNSTITDGYNAFVSNTNWTAQKKGKYTFDISMLFGLMFGYADGNQFFIVGGPVTGAVRLVINAQVVYSLPFSLSFTNGPFINFVVFPSVQSFSYTTNLNANDTAYIQIYWTYPESNYTSKIVNELGQGLNGNFQLRVQPGSVFKVTYANEGIVETDPVDMNRTLPEGVTQRDYVKSIFSMFNLMVLDDAESPNTLIIEPRDDFYRKNGDFVDWSKKLDRSSYTLSPLSELTNKTYLYAYKEDSDYYNNLYQTNYAKTFGSLKFEIDNDFLSDVNTVDNIFSPTPNAKDSSTSLSMPHFLTYDNSGVPKTKKTNIRLLFYSGLKTGSFTFKATTESPSLSALTSFPYVGMQNDPDNPTADLCFDSPNVVYYEQDTWTDATLYNTFHKNTFEELSSVNSKLLTGYFDLTPYDIAKFDFRDKVLVDGIYWRINKIENYSPIDNRLTKVELFSPIDPFLFVPNQRTLLYGYNQNLSSLTHSQIVIGGGSGPSYSPDTTASEVNGNLSNSVNSSSQGSNNLIGANNSISIIGDLNQVGDNVNGGLVIGSGNTISSNLSNVIILGSNDTVVTESNVVVINDTFIYKEGSGPIPLIGLIDGGYNTVQNPFNKIVPVDVVDAGANAVRPLGTDSIVSVVDSGLDSIIP